MLVKAKVAAAKAQERINQGWFKSLSSVWNKHVMHSVSMEAKANKMLDEANAMAELNHDTA